MDEPQTQSTAFDLTGGRLCLDFANTLEDRPASEPRELLRTYPDLVAWSRQTELLRENEARRLLSAARQRPDEAAAVLERAIALREAIYRIFSAVAAGQSPADADLVTLSEAVAQAWSQAKIVQSSDGFGWDWAHKERLDRVLWPVARSAAELLTSQELPSLRLCPAHDCEWLFIDNSRNQSRRWCNMQVCGNRAKARRFHQRRRQGARSNHSLSS